MTNHDDRHPALSCIELQSIARGFVVVDEIVKRAQVQLLHHGRHSDGRYIILFAGAVANVEESYEAGLASSTNALLDHMILPHVHQELYDALDGAFGTPQGDGSLLIVETRTTARLLENVDSLLKAYELRLVDMQLAQGLGGKAFVALQGPLYDLEDAYERILERIAVEQRAGLELIASPHPEMLASLGHSHPFHAWRPAGTG